MTPRIFIPILAGAGLSALAACSSSNSPEQPDVQLSAYAASTNYPSVQADTAKDIGAVLEPSSKVIRVLNFGQNAVNTSEVWLNGTYVYKVDTIPGEGYVTLKESDFYDHGGHSFADQQATPTKIELRNGDHLWTLMGPIVE